MFNSFSKKVPAPQPFLREITIIDMHLKLKRTPGLYLVGFMASGKTTVGGLLARHLGWSFTDIDSEIERVEGRTVSRIFLEEGEAAFRTREATAIRKHVEQIQTGLPRVLALGGGAFIQETNWELLKDNGITIWLDCHLDTVHRRLRGDTTRPLAENRHAMAQLYADRRSLYARADFRVDADDEDPGLVVTRVAALPIF